MIFKKLLHRSLAALGLVAVASCATAPQPAPAVQPALWRVADEDTTVYLFGTIHLLPENYDWRTAAFNQAVNSSSELVVETILDESNPNALAAQLAQLAIHPGLPPITERVAAEKRGLLEASIAKTGIPRAAFDQMETWAAAFMILGAQFKDLGLSAGEGVETVLRQNFKAAGKPIGQLESNLEQLSLFDTLPESAQRALLEGSIETPTEMQGQFGSMLASWARGDVEAIAKSFNQDLAGTPELQDALLRRRNRNWTDWVRRRMASPGSVLMAVGAGHLAGTDSVVDLLQRNGYRVERVQ